MPIGSRTSDIVCPGCDKTIRDVRRYRLEPLAEYLKLSLSQTCIDVRLSGRTQKEARCHGVTRRVVDTICGKLRIHPSEVWPEVIDHDIEDTTRECAYRSCEVRFTPKRRDHKFCSRRCAQRVAKAKYARKRYASDPEYRQKNREAYKRYQAENQEYLKRSRRLWRAKRLAENPNYDKDHYQRYREANLAYYRARAQDPEYRQAQRDRAAKRREAQHEQG